MFLHPFGLFHPIFTARRYASAVFAVVVCPSVRPSQAGIVSKRLAESSWVSARRLPSIYPTLSCKEIRVSPKIMVLSSGSLSQTLDVDNFATASRSCCQHNSSTVELADRTYYASWLVAHSLLHVGRL